MNLFAKLIDIIYPPKCPICRVFLQKNYLSSGSKRRPFCHACYSDFHKITSPLCPICGRTFGSGIPEDHRCEDCLRSPPFFDALRAPYVYNGAIMKAIHRFKYGAESSVADSLGPLLAEFAQRWAREWDDIITIPVPLHPKRLRERGFNQSLLLARHVAGTRGSQPDFLSLRRVRHTRPQTGLKKEERRKNVQGAFHLNNADAFKGKKTLLVDDVATTGNTLNECARMLREAGASKVFCLTLVRTGDF